MESALFGLSNEEIEILKRPTYYTDLTAEEEEKFLRQSLITDDPKIVKDMLYTHLVKEAMSDRIKTTLHKLRASVGSFYKAQIVSDGSYRNFVLLLTPTSVRIIGSSISAKGVPTGPVGIEYYIDRARALDVPVSFIFKTREDVFLNREFNRAFTFYVTPDHKEV